MNLYSGFAFCVTGEFWLPRIVHMQTYTCIAYAGALPIDALCVEEGAALPHVAAAASDRL
jgi:hypothetical protein